MLIPITWNFFRERNFKTTEEGVEGQFDVGDFIATASINVSLRNEFRYARNLQLSNASFSKKTRALINFSEDPKTTL